MNGPPAFSIQLTAPTATSGTLEVPATGYSQAFSLSAGEVASVDLPDAIWYPEGSESVGIFGVRIRSEDPIEAVAFHWRLYFSEASRLLPREELGTDYHVLTVQDLNDGPTGFTVVATQDGTEVEVTPSAFTLGPRPENTPSIITLNEGEVWPVQANADLSGSRVRSLSGQPIAVFAGARQPIVGCGRGATSHVWEQLPPHRPLGPPHHRRALRPQERRHRAHPRRRRRHRGPPRLRRPHHPRCRRSARARGRRPPRDHRQRPCSRRAGHAGRRLRRRRLRRPRRPRQQHRHRRPQPRLRAPHPAHPHRSHRPDPPRDRQPRPPPAAT